MWRFPAWHRVHSSTVRPIVLKEDPTAVPEYIRVYRKTRDVLQCYMNSSGMDWLLAYALFNAKCVFRSQRSTAVNPFCMQTVLAKTILATYIHNLCKNIGNRHVAPSINYKHCWCLNWAARAAWQGLGCVWVVWRLGYYMHAAWCCFEFSKSLYKLCWTYAAVLYI